MLDWTHEVPHEGTDWRLHVSCLGLNLLTCYRHTCLADEEEDYMYEGLTDDEEEAWEDDFDVAAEEDRYAHVMRPGAPFHPGVPF